MKPHAYRKGILWLLIAIWLTSLATFACVFVETSAHKAERAAAAKQRAEAACVNDHAKKLLIEGLSRPPGEGPDAHAGKGPEGESLP